MTDRPALMSANLDRALRWAAECHAGQSRKGTGTPYVQHVTGVAMILDRLGYPEDVVIAGLLHDVVEDTEATLDDVRARFGPDVAALVAHGSELKLDASGRKRPWIDRKRDHLAALAGAPAVARALVLADKLHNLVSIAADLEDGRPVWSLFNAARDQVLWYYATTITTLGAGPDDGDDPRLTALTGACGEWLRRVEAFPRPAGA